ncbi:MAG: hemolysin D [Nitrosomonas sp.]|nr:MAG: hemolysin D [Nitrosomonas sp.]
MTQAVTCPISGETEREEYVNTWTHFIGLVLGFIGWMVLLVRTWQAGDIKHFTSCAVYGLTLVLLYAASTYYHACRSLSQKRLMRIADHSCIFLLIAGTYTPFAVGPLHQAGGWELLYLEWSIAFVGIVFKFFAIDKLRILSTLAYIAMGWLVVFTLPSLMAEMSLAAFVWLMAGGVAYTVGTVFYAWENLPFSHAVWHVFVLAGSICHYFAIYCIVPELTTW